MQSLAQADGRLIDNWYILALVDEVPAKRPIKRWLYETPYVVFRDGEGKPAVLKDKCPHRGAQLSLGSVVNGEIRCPYHGWAFDRSGQVREIPSEGENSRTYAAGKKWCAGQVPVAVIDGCVWIWTGDPARATAAPSWRFPRFGERGTHGYFMITDFENEVTHLVQNFMDVPHTVFVHSKWFRNRSLLKVPVRIRVGDGRVHVTYDQPNDSIGFTERVLNPRREPMIHTDEFIHPNITRVDYKFGDKFFIINSQCSPIGPLKTRVYTWIAYDVGRVSWFLKPFLRFYTRKVITQDVEIMKNQGDNFRHWGKMEFRSTPADELHLAIDRLREMGARENSAAETVRYDREREFWI